MSTPLTLRPIAAADNPVVAAIIRSVMTEWGASGRGFAIHDAEVDCMSEAYATSDAAYYVVVEPDGTVVGGGGVAPLLGGDADICELKKMYFLPRARGRGAGRAVLSVCLEHAKVLGYTQCYLETLGTMDDARRLYEAAGFVKISGPLGATGHGGCNTFYIKRLSDGC